MKCNEYGLDIIKTFEGFSPTPYLCPAGYWTIGYGSTRGLDGKRVTSEHPAISKEQAVTFMQHELRSVELAIKALIRVPLSENQFSALCSFSYNVGTGNLSASTLRQRLNRGDTEGAAGEFLKWRRAGGVVLAGLVRRREMERQLFLR